MVHIAVASSATLQIDGPVSPAVALWRLVGTLTVAQAEMLADEIKLLAGAASPARPSGEPGARVAEGVRERHATWCAVRQGGACGCLPRWEAWVYSRTDRAHVVHLSVNHTAPAANPQGIHMIAEFAACMRQNGVDVPAPTAARSDPQFDTRGIDTRSSRVRVASAKCGHYLTLE
jgi:hypothetical protein